MADTGSIQLKFNVEYEDVLHAANVYDSRELFGMRRLMLDEIVGIAGGIAFYYLYHLWWTLLLGVVFFPLFRLMVFLIRRGQCRAIWQAKIAQGPFEVTFDEKGMVSQSSVGRVELAWDAFQKLIESPRCFLLIYSKYGYVTLPKRAFADEEEINRFRALTGEHIPSQSAS